jgi:phosphohistidine phosphatase
MQRLILLRHGKAESVAASGGDFERGLTERGRRDAALIGRVLAAAGMTPDLALVSAARRARETWEQTAPAFPHARCESSRLLYLASSEQLAQLAAGATEPVNSLIIVGHNPGLHDFALPCSPGSRRRARRTIRWSAPFPPRRRRPSASTRPGRRISSGCFCPANMAGASIEADLQAAGCVGLEGGVGGGGVCRVGGR